MIKYRAAIAEYRLNLAAAWVSMFQGIAKAVASAAFPKNIPAIIFATAMGGLQIAKIKQQKPSPPEFETGGVFLGPGEQYTGTGAGVPAIIHPPETILNGEQMKKVYDMINAGTPGGGAASIPVSVTVILDSYIIGKIVEDMANGGQIQFKPERALRK